MELQHKPPHVMSAGMVATRLIGLCFIDGPVNATSYGEMRHYTAEHLFQNSAQIVIAVLMHSHLSHDNASQRVVWCDEIRTTLWLRMMVWEMLVSHGQSSSPENVHLKCHAQ
jgi:hypothetical protein